MAITYVSIKGTPCSDAIWHGDAHAGWRTVPVLLSRGGFPGRLEVSISIDDSSGLQGHLVELYAWTPEGGLTAAPGDLFDKTSEHTDSDGKCSFTISSTVGYGITIRAVATHKQTQAKTNSGVKVILVYDKYCYTTGRYPDQFCVYYATHVASDGKPDPHVPKKTDYPRWIAECLAKARDVYQGDWGFRSLLYNDGGCFRTVLLNVLHIMNAAGWCESQPPKAGQTHWDALVYIDRDLSETPALLSSSLAHIAGHELFHAVQHRYSDAYQDPNMWLFEATADWAPGKAFPGNDIFLGKVWHYLPNLADNDRNWLDLEAWSNPRMYGRSIFFRHLTDTAFPGPGNGPEVVRRIWERFEQAGSGGAIWAVQEEIRSFGQTVAEAFRQFAYDAWWYTYPVPRIYPRSDVTLTVPGSASWNTIELNHLAPAYHGVAPDPANTAAGKLTVYVEANWWGNPWIDNVWRARVALVGAQGEPSYRDVELALDTPKWAYTGETVIEGFGPVGASGTVIRSAAVGMSNVTFRGTFPAVWPPEPMPEGKLDYYLSVKLE